MAIAARLTARAVAPEIGGAVVEVAEGFAKVSRAVRLTLILEARLEQQILAYRNGDFAVFDEAGTRSAIRGAPDPGRRVTPTTAPRSANGTATVKARNSIALPTGGFKAWVAEICDDLGLDPDWSCWSDEEGFIRDGQPVTDWPARRDPPSTPAPDSGAGFHARP